MTENRLNSLKTPKLGWKLENYRQRKEFLREPERLDNFKDNIQNAITAWKITEHFEITAQMSKWSLKTPGPLIWKLPL